MNPITPRVYALRAILTLFVGLSGHQCFAELGANKTEPLAAGLKPMHLLIRAHNEAYTVQEITLDTGTLVKEYINTSGKVFGVSWQGPFKPDLRLFLGDSALNRLHSDKTLKVTDHHHSSVNSSDLIIISKGMGRSFTGKAFAPLLEPESIGIDQIQ